MALVPLRIARTAKPPAGTPIDWSNPLSRGILLCTGFGDAGGSPNETVNAVRVPITYASGASSAWAADGLMLLSNAGTNGNATMQFRTPLASDKCLLMAEGTIFVHALNLGATSSDQGIFQASDGGNNRRWLLHTGTGVDTHGLRIHCGGAYRDILTSGVPRRVPHTAGFTWRNGGENGDGYYNGVQRLTWTGGTTQSANFTTVPLQGNALHYLCLTYSRALTKEEMVSLSANPWQIYEPEILWISTGGGTLSETLTSTITSLAAAEDRQDYIEAATSLIQSGATADAVQAMIEAVLTLAASSAAATDIATLVEQCQTIVQSAANVIDAVDYIESLLTTIQSSTVAADVLSAVEQAQTVIQSAATIADVAQLVERLLTTVQSQVTVTDTLQGGQTFSETLLSTAISAAQANEAQAYVDTVNTMAQTAASLTELRGLVESIGTTVQSISTVSEQQLFLENVAIIAQSGASLTEIGSYIDQVQTMATSQVSLVDVLGSAFIGKYIFQNYCSPRSFADLARPRSFADLCSPGRA